MALANKNRHFLPCRKTGLPGRQGVLGTQSRDSHDRGIQGKPEAGRQRQVGRARSPPPLSECFSAIPPPVRRWKTRWNAGSCGESFPGRRLCHPRVPAQCGLSSGWLVSANLQADSACPCSPVTSSPPAACVPQAGLAPAHRPRAAAPVLSRSSGARIRRDPGSCPSSSLC